MDPFNDITDEEFVPFLNKLGVDSYKKSFEWMLSDPDFAGILRWLYNNLDQNNALNVREACRCLQHLDYTALAVPANFSPPYPFLISRNLHNIADSENLLNSLENIDAQTDQHKKRLQFILRIDDRYLKRYAEIKKSGSLLSSEDLESSLSSLLEECPGLALPGDAEGLEELKMETELMQERLDMLEKQEGALMSLILQNEQTKEQLNSEITKLSSAERQCKEEEGAMGAVCVAGAGGAGRAAAAAAGGAARALAEHSDTYTDKEAALKFFAFGPFESYRQSQSLFRSHFDLFSSRRLAGRGVRRGGGGNDARKIEERLTEVIQAYIESAVDLAGERAKLALAAEYEDVAHPSQIQIFSIEAKSAAELCSQEELILEEQVKMSAAALSGGRAALRAAAALAEARGERENILKDLSWLSSICAEASATDGLLLKALRAEGGCLARLGAFATQLKGLLLEESAAVKMRIDTMNALCLEQETARQRHQTTNYLLKSLSTIFSTPVHEGALVKIVEKLEDELRELRGRVEEGRRSNEERIRAIKQKSQPIRARLFDGCTRQPNCRDRGVAALSHSLTARVSEIEDKVVEAGAAFTKVKNGDKKSLRKLWQWFMVEPARLRTVVRETAAASYS